MSDIALVTANFGGIDEPRSLPEHDGIDAFYFTDLADLPADAARTWNRIVVPDFPRYDFGPRLRAKYFKLQIHRLEEVSAYRWLAWADASLAIHQLGFLRERARQLAELPPHGRCLLIPHPDRATVLEEYEFVQRLIAEGHPTITPRYAREKMSEQIAYFQRRGWNLQARLWCGGFWMLENSAANHAMLNEWWDQNLRFGMMDQLSLPVALEHCGIEPCPLDINLWNNELFRFQGHKLKM